MNNNENLFSLTGGEIYMTRSETDAFRVKSGTVLIYIVPLRNGKPGRRSFLYEILNTVIGASVFVQLTAVRYKKSKTAQLRS